jgi:hypothetical protein
MLAKMVTRPNSRLSRLAAFEISLADRGSSRKQGLIRAIGAGRTHARVSRARSHELQFNGDENWRTYIGIRRDGADKSVWREPMTKIKTLTAMIILSTAVATPVFAKGNMAHNETLRRAYDQVTVPSFGVTGSQSERNIENFGFSGIDHSFPGGRDPSLNPSGS